MPEQIVFVVARDPVLRRALARAISDTPGLQAVTMSGAASVVSLARSARPVAIVVEPEPDLLDRLREHPETSHIPLVALADPASPPAIVAAVRRAIAPTAPQSPTPV
jgi:DNA-binding NarL/FixJ family response regulator